MEGAPHAAIAAADAIEPRPPTTAFFAAGFATVTNFGDLIRFDGAVLSRAFRPRRQQIAGAIPAKETPAILKRSSWNE